MGLANVSVTESISNPELQLSPVAETMAGPAGLRAKSLPSGERLEHCMFLFRAILTIVEPQSETVALWRRGGVVSVMLAVPPEKVRE